MNWRKQFSDFLIKPGNYVLTFKIKQTSSVTTILLQGRFDSSGAILFEEQITGVNSANPVLDFSEVDFLSSAGIRVLLKSEKELRQKNGKIIFTAVPENIKQVFSITGLVNAFTFADTIKEAEEQVHKSQGSAKELFSHPETKITYSIKKFSTAAGTGDIWFPSEDDKENLAAVTLNEFDFAIGYGGLGSSREIVKNSSGRLLLTKNFIGLLPDKDQPDYLISYKPEETILFINSASNFSGMPNIMVETGDDSKTICEQIKYSFFILSDYIGKPVPFAGFVLIAETEDNAGLFAAGFIGDKLNPGFPPLLQTPNSTVIDENIFFDSIGVKLKSIEGINEDVNHALNSIIHEENISEVIPLNNNIKIRSAKVWLYMPEFRNAQDTRLKIALEKGVDLRDEFEVIIRSIYSDCSSIQLQQLHGGFSAKTFQVFGYDKRGIRILPTVLKLAKRSTIQREVKNYEESVKRYILNNGTSILGSFFYGNFGGVRYNFVGITGPDSKISWLTDYYRSLTAEELIPMFDRVFTDILRPWYGQPRLETFSAYKEHNPTYVFFPELFEKCQEVFGISPDQERICFEELGRETVNPYWFLKHGYKAREKKSKLWYKCICHGDLNMQNILLDEIKNIYIIDYSETSIRNAVADFARLEPIFKFEFPIINPDEMKNLIQFEQGLLDVNKLEDVPKFTYPGNDPFVEKAYKMICRMRKYAKTVTLFENDLVPYLLAVLEWTYAVVCYQSVDDNVKRYSAISAALMCEKIIQLENI